MEYWLPETPLLRLTAVAAVSLGCQWCYSLLLTLHSHSHHLECLTTTPMTVPGCKDATCQIQSRYALKCGRV